MAKTVIDPDDLGDALRERLTLYHEDVTERVDAAGETAIQELVKKTKATAPKGARGDFRRHIAWKAVAASRFAKKFFWYVKAPDYRLTHLLVKGHATRDGDRTDPDPFLANALDEVLPEYEKDVKEAIQNGK